MPEQNNYIDKPKNQSVFRLTILIIILISCYSIYMKNAELIKDSLISAYNKTVLFLLGKEIELPQTAPVFFDKDMFIKEADRNLNNPKKSDFYWHHYENYEALYASSGLILPETENVKFSNPFLVYLNIKEKYSCFDTTIYYKEHLYDLKGIFKIQDYTEADTEIDFDQGNWATFIYEYGNDKQAFFVRNLGYSEYKVYFEQDDILYQLTVPDTEENIAAAKELIKELNS